MTRKLPLSMSGDNMFSMECAPTGHTPAYAVCQHTVWAYKQGRLRNFEECRAAIEARTCPAIRMMVAEKKQGKALFYESYQAILDARDRREQKRQEASRRRKQSRIIETSRSEEQQARDRARSEALQKRFDEQGDTVERRLEKSRQKRPVSDAADPMSDNMFAEVVNQLSQQEPQ